VENNNNKQMEKIISFQPSDPAVIAPGLLLGSKLAAEDLARLRDHGVTHVLNAAREIPNYHEGQPQDGGPALTYLHLSLNDDAEDDIEAEFVTCNAWIKRARENGGVVFVHC
jgi:protein-tyrosine phosphatase